MADTVPGIPPIPIAAGAPPELNGPAPVMPVAPYAPPLALPWPPPELGGDQPLPELPKAPEARPLDQVDAFGRPWGWAGGYEGKDVPEVQTGEGLALQHQPTQAPAAPAKGQAQGGATRAPAQPATDPYLDAERKAAEQEAAAVAQEAAATKAKNDYLAAATIEANDAANKRIAAADKARLEANQSAKAKTAQLTAEATNIANTKMDSGRIFRGGAGFVGSLSLGIGAILAGASTASIESGKNSVVDLAMSLVDRDLQSQAQDLANRREGLATKRGLLADEVAQGREDYDIAFKGAMTGLEMAKNQTLAYAMRFDNPVIDARAQKELAAISARQAKLAQDHMQQGEATDYGRWKDAEELKLQKGLLGVSQYNARTSRMGAENDRLARGDAALAREEAARAAAAKLSDEQRQRAILDPQGRPMMDSQGGVIMAPDPKIALEERQKQAAGWAYYEELQRYKKATDDMGREFGGVGGILGSTEAKSRAESMHKSLMMKYKTAEHLGALDAGAIKVFNDVVQPPSTWTSSSNPAASADEAARVWKDTKNVEMRQVWRYGGNWVDDYEKEVGFDKDATEAAGNKDERARNVEKNPLVFYDDKDGYNTEGRGRPLDEKETAGYRAQKAEFERKQARLSVPEWKYQRSQNNIHVAQRRPGALPFPDVGTGSMEE